MSDEIKHECGIALVRLRKPLSYFKEKYGTPFYGLNKLYLLMEKQHNRGQDGAGIATIKLDPRPGTRYISRKRSISNQPIKDIFKKVFERTEKRLNKEPGLFDNMDLLKEKLPYSGELLLGHLRYGTHGVNSIERCHPFLRQNNWMSRNLVLAGNFNFTNVDEQFDMLVDLGQHPKEKADTVIALEKIGHFLDEENIRLFYQNKSSVDSNIEANKLIQENLDIKWILQKASSAWDGGYSIAGLIGHGDAFVMRDRHGIRPAFYYSDDEVFVAASERPCIMTAFGVSADEVHAVDPGGVMIVKKDGSIRKEQILKPAEPKQCSFERIYFSRGNDKDIYQERRSLGKKLVPAIMDAIDDDIENTVFSFIPNTAETAFYGMVTGLNDHINSELRDFIRYGKSLEDPEVQRLMHLHPRIEKVAVKDVKMRTFISEDKGRNDLVEHVYDISYGTIVPDVDNLVVIDDSIVRGTTLHQSILKNLDRLKPKRIIVASSAPQIRFPDCYGIDMSRLKNFVAFRAAISLIEERNMEDLLEKTYSDCLAQVERKDGKFENKVKAIYEPFTYEEVSNRIAKIVKPEGMKADVEVVYQSLHNLHEACPQHLGDWYFSGDYPTAGGNRVVCQAFINYMEKSEARAY